MNVELTASQDAGRTEIYCENLERTEVHGSEFVHRVSCVRRWVVGTLAGLCFTASTTSAAIGPASASQPASLASLLRFVAIESAPINLADASAATIEVATPAAAVPDLPVDPSRELETVELPELIEIDPRSAIITGIPLEPLDQADLRDGRPSDDCVYFEDRRVPRWIVDTIMRASEATGADPVYMMALADKESSFIPSNKATTSSAEGLFQFISSTWLEVIRSFGSKHGYRAEAEAIEIIDGQLTVADDRMRDHILRLRRSAYVSALMAGELKRRDTETIEAKLGRKISRSEYYLSHFFGVDRARRFMALVEDKPKQSAPRLFPAAAKANKALFFAKAGRKTRHRSVAEVYKKIDAMIDTRLDLYESVLESAAAGVAL